MGKLGIFVCSDRHLDHMVGIAKAAIGKGNEVQIFFTGPGVKLSPDPEVQGLVEAGAKVKLCDLTYKKFELDKQYGEELAGIKHGGQHDNAEMIGEVDRYVVF